MISTNDIKNDINALINGELVKGILHVTVSTSNCYTADIFSVSFSIGPPPLHSVIFWASLSNAYLEIRCKTGPASEMITLVTGMLDSMTIDPVNGIVSVEGRDLSASLVDSSSQQDFVNQTASEIVCTIAQNHGLDAVVSSTLGSVGRYIGENYTKLSLDQFSRFRSDWDLVVELARENIYDVFVKDRTLYFQPAVNAVSEIRHLNRSDYKSIRLERMLSSDIKQFVRMQSWNCQNMTSYLSGSSLIANDTNQVSSVTQSANYLFSNPNLTSQQVDQAAARYAREVGRLQVVGIIEAPWDLTINPRSLLYIEETYSALDGLYQVESIDRHYTSSSGSSQLVRAFHTLN